MNQANEIQIRKYAKELVMKLESIVIALTRYKL